MEEFKTKVAETKKFYQLALESGKFFLTQDIFQKVNLEVDDETTKELHANLRAQINKQLVKAELYLNKFDSSYNVNLKRITEHIQKIIKNQKVVD